MPESDKPELNPSESAAEWPVLVFDGECGFCRVWVEYWKRLTGERVEYVAFQAIGRSEERRVGKECRL